MNKGESFLFNADCLEQLKELPDDSVDSVVTDPPYGLAFMGKKWDYDVPSAAIWREVLRVLKPGAHLLSFGGTRTYHRMVVAIEDAGFEIRDQIQWLYGSGFPKSHNLEGNWQGWGTALKPANEPIVLARKPLIGTVAQNVAEHGTGALNIDASRIEGVKPEMMRTKTVVAANCMSGISTGATGTGRMSTQGRWPTNVLLDEEAAAVLDDQTQHLHGAGFKRDAEIRPTSQNIKFKGAVGTNMKRFGDTGGASRFFYVAKASKRERNAGLEGMPERVLATSTGQTRPGSPARLGADPHAVQAPVANYHPTVKPIALMEYLIRLVTPAGGIVLDPFMGSGTTGVAAVKNGWNFIGIEREPEYFKIAEARVAKSGEAA